MVKETAIIKLKFKMWGKNKYFQQNIIKKIERLESYIKGCEKSISYRKEQVRLLEKRISSYKDQISSLRRML